MYSGANPRDIAFADYNNDGRLDAYTGHTHLYTGSGSGSSRDFDETTPTSFSGVSNSNRSDCISWVDYNNDGLMDIFVTNSNGTTTNYLYRNDGGGVFTSVTSTPDLVASQNSYGCAWGDIDNDGDMDVWVSNANVADRLFLNNGDGTFTRVTSGPVVTDHAANQAGAEWADYDNDGDLDLFVPAFNTNYLFDNNGDGTFTRNITEIPATDLSVESYGAAWADFDNDGDLDLFVPTGYGNPNDLFYLNNANPSETSNRNYLKLVCVGVTSNKSAIGARVYVKANVNGNNIWQMREINGNSTRGGNNGGVSGRVVHFGLGDATQIDSLKIVWPASSTEQVFLNVHVNKFARVFENDNTLHDIVPCTCDLPGSGLGYVSGRIYHDTNEDCVYDPGIDVPIVNKYVQAEPGAYFTLTNDSGVYTLDLPPGNYDISTNFYEDNWYLSSCQTDSLIYTTSVLADTIHDIDFSEQARIRPCQGAYIINTTSIGIVQGPCDDGLILTSPCQTFNHQYCFTVTNNSTLPSAAGTVMNITFPPGYIVLGTATNLPPCFVSETHTSNTANITLNVLNPGDICTVCLIVTVGGSAPFSTTFDYINPGGVVNLIVDGSFESGLVNFNSDAPYNLNCTAPTTQSDYCIGNTPWTMNGGFQNPLPAADGTLYLYADGSITANSRIWWQVVPVQANTRYTFSGAFCNVNIANIPNLTAPNMSLSVNGTPPIATTGPLAPGGNWNQAAGTWCSPATGTATLEIMSSVVALFGNDFGIDNLVFIENEARPFILLETDTCGCDPNDKMVTPKGCGENGNIEKNQKLNYKVRFENTGTGNAHDIVIRDEIDSDLDLPTLEILGASHTITNVQIIPDTALIITLGGIELEPDSSGFIAFNISPKQGLDDGTQITNQAGIYFDNNEVVVTNVTLNTVYDIPEPDAAFSYDHDCVSTGMVYDFEYTGNTPDNATFAWTFTDGTPSTSSSQNPDNITFSSAGYKYVTLTVSRNGCTNAVYDTILVKDYVINNELVIICHGEEVDTILISTLETHLSHGDCVGECDGAGSRIAQSEPVIKTEKPFEVNVKPNPANESCIVSVLGTNSGDHLCLELISFTGYVARVIYNDVPEKNMAPLLQTSVDLSNITSGFYLLKVQYGAEVKLIKLIVQH